MAFDQYLTCQILLVHVFLLKLIASHCGYTYFRWFSIISYNFSNFLSQISVGPSLSGCTIHAITFKWIRFYPTRILFSILMIISVASNSRFPPSMSAHKLMKLKTNIFRPAFLKSLCGGHSIKCLVNLGSCIYNHLL